MEEEEVAGLDHTTRELIMPWHVQDPAPQPAGKRDHFIVELTSDDVSIRTTNRGNQLLDTTQHIMCQSLIFELEFISWIQSPFQNPWYKKKTCRSNGRIRWAGHVARMEGEEKRNVYRLLVGKPEGKRPLERPT
jgi:hypothetical protein